MADDREESCLESVLRRHKKENKDLQGKIQSLKHSVPKGDKKKKREITLEIAKLEAEQEQRHKREIEEVKTNGEATTHTQNSETNLSERLEETSISPEGSGKASRAQKRRVKKAAKDQEREHRITAAEAENVNSARNVEAEKMKQLLNARNLEIVEIPPDGHCLYNAVADQMKRRDMEIQLLSLRQQTADYMSSHADDFLPFLTHPESGELYTPDQFSQYCEEVATTSAWGGQLELRALSHVLRMPIEVLQADAPAIKIGEEYESQPVILSYHHHAYGLGEHYNSVIAASIDTENS